LDDFKSFQQQIFDRDADGAFIRDGISFRAKRQELNPDAPLINVFVSAEKEGNNTCAATWSSAALSNAAKVRNSRRWRRFYKQ